MKTIVTILALSLIPSAFAVTKEECESQGRKFHSGLITRSGTYRKPRCGKKPKTKGEIQNLIRELKMKYPDARVSGEVL